MLVLAAGLVVAILTPGFLTTQNIRSALALVAVIGIAAVGLTAITVSGNLFSVSTGPVATAVALCYAELLRDGMGVGVSLLVAFLIAALLGLLQGAIVAAGMNPIVTTLAVGGALTGLTPMIVKDQIIAIKAGGDAWIGQATFGGVSAPIVWFILATLCAAIVMQKTRGGRRLYLAGANKRTAQATGLRPATITCMAFVGASVAAGLAGVAGSAQVGLVQTNPYLLDTLTFNTITAVLVGGAVIQGGKGSPIGTALAAVFVGLVNNVVTLRGYSFGVQLAVTGVLVCVAMAAYSMLARAPE
jgi:ribose/xylose/arabinose/galactoside ABC-type transport system permease subunit